MSLESTRTQLGVGLPAMIPGVDPELIPRWAEHADAGPFASVATGELITSQAYDVMIALAVAGQATRRVRLLANVLVLPLHNAGIVAKQAASLDRLCGGRLSLGLGVGARKPMVAPGAGDTTLRDLPDFAAAPAPAEGRYERFPEQIRYMRRLWAGASDVAIPAVGPPPSTPGGPELLVGGYSPQLIESAVEWAAGLTAFGLLPDLDRMERDLALFRSAWSRAGRKGAPRLVATHFFALGPDAAAGARHYIESHYPHLGAAQRQQLAASITTSSEDGLRRAFGALARAGATEVVAIPMIPDLDQQDRLADTLGPLASPPRF